MPLDGGAVQNVENPIQEIANNAVHTVDFLELARSLPHPTIANKNRERDQGLSLETHRLGLEQFGQNREKDHRSGVVKCCDALCFFRRNAQQEAFRKVSRQKVLCKRGTEAFGPVDAHSLVPGDLIRINLGDKIPADCRVAKVDDKTAFQVDQSSLTGEPRPVTKTAGISNAPSHGTAFNGTSLNIEANNLVFFGSCVVEGAAELLVIKTGEASLLGSLARC
jgi:hypothetical protein